MLFKFFFQKENLILYWTAFCKGIKRIVWLQTKLQIEAKSKFGIFPKHKIKQVDLV